MTSPGVERYLRQLRHELRKRLVVDARLVEEVRGHLADAIEVAREEGASDADAEARAMVRVGEPALVAAAAAADRARVWHPRLLALATLAGLAIAYVDSRPGWDDAGITAGAMMLTAGLFGLLGHGRAWQWALAIGIWVPVGALIRSPRPASLLMLVVLAFPMAGMLVGRGVRRLLV